MAEMDIVSQSLLRCIGLILRHGSLLQRGIEVLKASFREFFLPQFQTRFGFRFRPHAILWHPLDDCLPLVPWQVRNYLGYLAICLKTLLCLYETYGTSALREIEQMMRDLVLLYETSGDVYRRCQSTTPSRCVRPLNPYFLLILLFDPHLHCIPSLHVLTICYNYHKTREVVRKFEPNGALTSPLAAQTYRLAVGITELILLVRQHSLLDIGPSLYLFGRLFPSYDEKEVRRFVSDLFAGNLLVARKTADQLRRVILESYLQMKDHERACGSNKPTEALLHFLVGHVEVGSSD